MVTSGTKSQAKPKPKPKPKKTWEWRDNYRASVPAPVAGAEIERIAKLSRTEVKHVTPDLVVESARLPDSPLHCCFEWQDDVAAHAYRKQEARRLIRNLVPIMIEVQPQLPPMRADVSFSKPEPPKSGPGFVSVKLPDLDENGYVATTDAMANFDLRAQVIRLALAYLKGAQKRFGYLSELKEIYEAIDKAEKKFPPR